MSENKKKVLMIEDDSFLRKLYRDKLIKEGIDFIEATNGVEGINKIKNENPDLIILDILLPSKGGFDLLEEKNKEEETKNIPVIVISNLGQEADVEEGKDLGVEDYFIKSEANFTEVVERVKELLQ